MTGLLRDVAVLFIEHPVTMGTMAAALALILVVGVMLMVKR